MNTLARQASTATGTVGVLIVLVLAITIILLNPPADDLVALTGFLLLSSGITVGFGVAVAHLGLPPLG